MGHKYITICHGVAVCIIAALFWANISAAQAQVDSIVLEYSPGNPCELIVDKFPANRVRVPSALKELRGKYKDKISINVRQYALMACEDAKQRITKAVEVEAAQLNPVDFVKQETSRKLNHASNELYSGFLHFVAEKARTPMIQALPYHERQKFQPGSPQADRMALEWLNSPQAELQVYLSAYLHAVGKDTFSSVGGLGAIFDDYMSGSSQEILDGFGGLMDGAQDRLDRFLEAKSEIVEKNSPIIDTLEKYGFSSEWANTLKMRETQLRKLESDYNVVAALEITYGAITSEQPDQKIKGFFGLISHFGNVADSSQVPMVSLVGQIVAAYGDVGLQMLEGLDSLETAIRTREGYCLGLGTHSGRDPREAKLADLQGRAFMQADIRICPLRLGRAPWQDIYFQDQPQDLNALYFYDGEKFIAGQKGGGGEAGVQDTVKLIGSAANNAFRAFEGKAVDVGVIAAVYNADFTAEDGTKGIPGLVGQVDTIVENTAKQIERINARVMMQRDTCPSKKVRSAISRRVGATIANFPSSSDQFKLNDLKTNMAASAVEKQRTFASSIPKARTGVYDRYFAMWQNIRDLSLLTINGRIVDARSRSNTCAQCAGASVSAQVRGGEQISGCEVRTADDNAKFSVSVLTDDPALRVTIKASKDGVRGEPYPVDLDYLNREGFSAKLPFFQSVAIRYSLDGISQDSAEDSGDMMKQVSTAMRQTESQCYTLKGKLREAQQTADAWGRAKSSMQVAQSVSTISPAEAAAQQDQAFNKALLAITHAEDASAKACNYAKDAGASFITTEQERADLMAIAGRHRSKLDGAVSDMQAAKRASQDIMARAPRGQSVGTGQGQYREMASGLLLEIPNQIATLETNLDDLQGLDGPLQRWGRRNDRNERSETAIRPRYEDIVSNMDVCLFESRRSVQSVSARLRELGAQAKPVEASAEWADIREKHDMIIRDHETVMGLRDKVSDCMGQPLTPLQTNTDNAWVASGWIGKQKLTAIAFSEPGVGSFSCDSRSSCMGALKAYMAAEDSANPSGGDDMGFGAAIEQAVRAAINFLFDGMETGVIVKSSGPNSFTLSAPDGGFGEATTLEMSVRQVRPGIYEGKARKPVEGTQSFDVFVTMDITARNRLTLETKVDVIGNGQSGQVVLVSTLHKGRVDGAAIARRNQEAVMRAFSNIQ